jgi:predicted dehydrogenase
MRKPLSRRTWLQQVMSGSAALVAHHACRTQGASTPATYRAAILGHTGRGDFGHGYDQVFQNVPGVAVEAVADPDPVGRAKAKERSGARQSYADYRTLLREVKPDLVAIATRYPDQHRDMALAAAEVCRGIFIEKPFTETVREADEVLEAAARRGVKIQVAHNRRYTREFVRVKALLAEGFAGTIREVQIHGKQDHRAGGEDLMVLGTHDFDLMRFYFGDPRWCLAHVGVQGRDAGPAEVRQGQEPLRVQGDTLHALFGFPANIVVRWSSVTAPAGWAAGKRRVERWSFEILGTHRILAYQSGAGDFGYLDSPFLLQRDTGLTWQSLPEPNTWDWPSHAQHPIRSLIHALENHTEPVCSGSDGRWAIEMVAAVYQSHRRQARIDLPLQDRSDPLREGAPRLPARSSP